MRTAPLHLTPLCFHPTNSRLKVGLKGKHRGRQATLGVGRLQVSAPTFQRDRYLPQPPRLRDGYSQDDIACANDTDVF